MAPTTRAGTKRLRGEATNSNKPVMGRKRQVKKASKAVSSKRSVEETEQPFRFLDLSAELRNLIYEFAAEDLGNDRFAPRVGKGIPAKPHSTRLWKFFALTQTCKQLRAEYRPIWLQGSSIRLTIYQLGTFVDTFLPRLTDFQHTPQLLQISWDHESDKSVYQRHDITPLVRMRAYCHSFMCEFVPFKLAADISAEDDVCNHCMEMFHLEEHGLDAEDNMWDECTCPPIDMDPEDWEMYLFDEMDYTSVICDFALNDTRAWLDDIRKDRVTVHCSFARGSDRITFRILYTEQVYTSTSESQPALDLLRTWGMLDLPLSSEMDLTVAYEDKKVSEQGGYEMTNSVVREVRVVPATSSH